MRHGRPLRPQWRALVDFRLTDAGRATSRTPREVRDCAVRVLALACNLPYDTAHKILAEAGRPWGRGFNLPQWFRHVGHIKTTDWHPLDYRDSVFRISSAPATTLFRWIGFPSVKGHKRMTQAEFVRKYPVGSYIAGTPKHVEFYRDGTLYDDKPSRLDRCFYGAWEVIDTLPTMPVWLVKGRRPGAPCAKRLGVVPGVDKATALAYARHWYGHLKGAGRITVERLD